MNEATATRTDANGAGMSAIWPDSAQRDHAGAVRLHGRSVEELSASFGTPLFVMDTEELSRRALRFSRTVSNAFHDTNTHVSFAGKAFLSKEVVRIMLAQGLLVDTCSMGEMRIALAAGAPGRRLVLHGNNKSDEEIRLAVEQGFAKIVVDSPDEPARIAEIARSLGATAKVMLRVTVGVHAGGHEFISTAHEDQKFGVPLLPAGADGHLLDLDTRPDHAGSSDGHEDLQSPAQAVSSLYVPTGKRPDDDAAVTEAMSVVADGPAIGVLKDILSRQPDLELVGVHAHIGSQIHDANAFIESARRLMILRKTFWATDGFLLPETDLGGGYSVAYTDDDASMDIEDAFATMSQAVEGDQPSSGPADAGAFLRTGTVDRRALRHNPVSGRNRQAGASGERNHPYLCLGRWRDERQHPSGLVRRAVHRDAGEQKGFRGADGFEGCRPSLRVRGYPGAGCAPARGRETWRHTGDTGHRGLRAHDGEQLQSDPDSGGRRRDLR